MTIHEASRQLRFQLFHLYPEREAGNITDLVMEHITGWQKIDRVVNKAASLSAAQAQELGAYTKALLQNEPLQYVLHEAWFYGMKLYVDENVLIPRPETEELVDWVVKGIGNGAPGVVEGIGKKLLDIGTGSGCIALAISKSDPVIEVHACDISAAALQVARKNAADLGLPVHFHQFSILAAGEWDTLPVFDIVMSNPPYIPQKDKNSMAANVLQYEPPIALFVDNDDPLVFYAAIADFALVHLAKNGSIYLEVHEEMAEAVEKLFTQKGFTGIEIRKDLQGKNRMVRVEW